MANDFCGGNLAIDCDDILVAIPVFGCEQVNNEGITRILYSSSPLVSGNLTEFNNRLSNSSTDSGQAIRSLEDVVASLPRVEPTFKTSARGTAIPLDGDYVISFPIEDDSDPSFEYFKQFQRGVKKRFWFVSGPHMYGGLQGIDATMLATYEINPDSELMAHNWALQIRFRATCFPPRTLSVI